MSDRLSSSVFDLDLDAVVPRIERFIDDRMHAFGKKGIVVALSGGLDSSTVLGLCTRSVGPERVTALLLPDRKGSADALRFGRLVADHFGVQRVEQDATALNRAAGAYRAVGYAIPGLYARIVAFKLAHTRGNASTACLRGTENNEARRMHAAAYTRQRLRMVMTYRHAELHGLLVVGSAHKSEALLGAFVKFGIDDSADVMPLKGLYRSQIRQIARYVSVPDEVLARTPNPELIPGVNDKYQDVFHVSSATADLILWGIEHGMSDDAIAREVPVPQAKVAEFRELVLLSETLRFPSQFPDDDH